MNPVLEETGFLRLLDLLRHLGPLAIAFSGGVDSSFLLAAAQRALGEKVLALTASTPYMAVEEVVAAAELAGKLGVRHRLVEMPIPQEIVDNPFDRCYLCKRALFSAFKGIAAGENFACLADGTNLDDSGSHRPGLRALAELGVRSPLLEAGLGKTEIRHYAQALNLSVWDKPAAACLLTRLPHGAAVRPDELRRIDQAESAMRRLGLPLVRVRCHGDLARIETDRAALSRFFVGDFADEVVRSLANCGFRHVTVDLRGYRTGSMDELSEEE